MDPKQFDDIYDELLLSDEKQLVIIRRDSGIPPEAITTLAVFPAAFNPVTMAHYVMATTSVAEAGEVLMVLDVGNPDKEGIRQSFQWRVTMLEQAMESIPGISIGLSSCGLFIEHLTVVQRMFTSLAEPLFVLGTDTFQRLFDPKYYVNPKESWSALLHRARLKVFLRGGWTEQRALELLYRNDIDAEQSRVAFCPLPSSIESISSTEVRERLDSGLSIEGMVPPVIEQFLTRGTREIER